MCKEIEDKVIIQVQDVTYTYEGETLPVWEHLSCCFFEGRIHVISGPSGCGKSSILYLLDGLIPHMYEGTLEGKVLFSGEDITEVMPRDRCDQIGFVMQNPESQFCTFTVEEELAFGMENLGVSRETMKEKITDTLRFVGMSGYETCNLNQLSGGQKQKIAIASLLVTEPKILMLDEPTANLDPISRKQIFDLIVRLAKEKHVSIIIVEHNIGEIIDYVDYIVALDQKGHVVLDGKREQILEDYWSLTGKEKTDGAYAVSYASDKEILKIEDITFSYPVQGKRKKREELSKNVLEHFNMSIYEKEFLAIVGENGVGKTTLMRLIFRIFEHKSGRILLYGKPVESYRKKDLYHLIGLVFQNPENQFVANTVFDEMMFSLKRVKISRQEKEERIEKMLKRFHLEKEKEKSPFVLSQGQKRRLSVASMLLTNQQVLFLDEPTYGQDYENRQEMMKDMQSLIEEGITIVMITHDLSLVRQYATRVVEIEKGQVKVALPVEEYFTNIIRGGV